MRLFLFFSHSLTNEQIEDAKYNLNIEEFVHLPKELQTLFSNVSPELKSLNEYVKPFKEFLKKKAKKDDLILIQGDFGLVCHLVDFSIKQKYIPVYATTKREVIVEKNGTKVSKFKHIIFRRYECGI